MAEFVSFDFTLLREVIASLDSCVGFGILKIWDKITPATCVGDVLERQHERRTFFTDEPKYFAAQRYSPRKLFTKIISVDNPLFRKAEFVKKK
jgi:hypothetical protein